MTSAYSTIPEAGLAVTEQLQGVEPGYYNSMFSLIDELAKQASLQDPAYQRARLIVSNYLYLIYERLKRNMVREIDYGQVKLWANDNRALAVFLLQKKWNGFPLEAFDNWISPENDLLDCAMYRPSNRFNKNTYH